MRKDTHKEEITFDEVYDQEEDIYYVSMKTGEPSYCIEMDDIIIAEVGMFTKAFTGFRVLNFNKNRPALTQMLLKGKLKEGMRESMKSVKQLQDAREAAFEQALEKVFA